MPYLCLQQEGNPSLPHLIEKAQQNGFNVVTVPVNVSQVPVELEQAPMCDHVADFTYPDLLLTAEQWNNRVILRLSDDIDCDSPDDGVRKYAEKILRRDISWAEHLQYAGYMMLRLKSGRNQNLAHIFTSIKGLLLVQVPLYNNKVPAANWRRDLKDEDELMKRLEKEGDSWHWWNRFRWAMDFNPKVKVALELNGDDIPTLEVVRRWLGEPLEAVIIPADLFIRNNCNYAVLPKKWQDILILFVKAHVNFIVSTNTQDNSLKNYSDYMNKFVESHRDKHELQSFEDCLEVPLQPLFENLDAYTYEIFEKDPVKYKLYQNAIQAALLDRVPDSEAEKKITVVMVVGAGRGPLVRSALNAAEITGRKIRVYIIEKNPNAIRTLTNIRNKLWHNKDVHIFSMDMREASPPEKADILVSELLGSFGDNELSPECLDGAQKHLKPDGISIPCKSTSFINPVMSSKIYNEVRHLMRNSSNSNRKEWSNTYTLNAESGYCTLLKNIYNIGLPKVVFEFVHPNKKQPTDNTRYKVLRFDVSMDCVMHGIAGFFDSVLYKDIKISINTIDHTRGMFSWFPMFFPITTPYELKKGQTVEIRFWRCVNEQKVWYEWCVSEPFCTHIHNMGGHSYPIFSH